MMIQRHHFNPTSPRTEENEHATKLLAIGLRAIELLAAPPAPAPAPKTTLLQKIVRLFRKAPPPLVYDVAGAARVLQHGLKVLLQYATGQRYGGMPRIATLMIADIAAVKVWDEVREHPQWTQFVAALSETAGTPAPQAPAEVYCIGMDRITR